MSKKESRSECLVACSLDLLGDKWTLLVIRDMLEGEKTYKQFQEAGEKIPTNILASRLKTLIEKEIAVKKPYQENPVRYTYSLTDKGKALWPVIRELMRWGDKYVPEGKLTPQAKYAIENF